MRKYLLILIFALYILFCACSKNPFSTPEPKIDQIIETNNSQNDCYTYLIVHGGELKNPKIYETRGESMLPFITPNSFEIVDKKFPYENLQIGDVVVFKYIGLNVNHILIRKTAKGWETWGINNAIKDDNVMNKSSYEGKVIILFKNKSGS